MIATLPWLPGRPAPSAARMRVSPPHGSRTLHAAVARPSPRWRPPGSRLRRGERTGRYGAALGAAFLKSRAASAAAKEILDSRDGFSRSAARGQPYGNRSRCRERSPQRSPASPDRLATRKRSFSRQILHYEVEQERNFGAVRSPTAANASGSPRPFFDKGREGPERLGGPFWRTPKGTNGAAKLT